MINVPIVGVVQIVAEWGSCCCSGIQQKLTTLAVSPHNLDFMSSGIGRHGLDTREVAVHHSRCLVEHTLKGAIRPTVPCPFAQIDGCSRNRIPHNFWLVARGLDDEWEMAVGKSLCEGKTSIEAVCNDERCCCPGDASDVVEDNCCH